MLATAKKRPPPASSGGASLTLVVVAEASPSGGTDRCRFNLVAKADHDPVALVKAHICCEKSVRWRDRAIIHAAHWRLFVWRHSFSALAWPARAMDPRTNDRPVPTQVPPGF